jgi:aconitate hydratase
MIVTMNVGMQGMLPLTFANPEDYKKVGTRDKISILGLPPSPGQQLQVKGTKPDGSTYTFTVNQTFNDNQLAWFKAGSALNAMGRTQKKVA